MRDVWWENSWFLLCDNTSAHTHTQLVIQKFLMKKESTENYALLFYYRVSSINFLPMFWDNLPFPSSRVKNPKRKPTVPIWSLYRAEGGQ
jgi:hypothetical protein